MFLSCVDVRFFLFSSQIPDLILQEYEALMREVCDICMCGCTFHSSNWVGYDNLSLLRAKLAIHMKLGSSIWLGQPPFSQNQLRVHATVKLFLLLDCMQLDPSLELCTGGSQESHSSGYISLFDPSLQMCMHAVDIILLLCRWSPVLWWRGSVCFQGAPDPQNPCCCCSEAQVRTTAAWTGVDCGIVHAV